MTPRMYACADDMSRILWWHQQKEFTMAQPAESVNSPPHYTSHPSGIECIQITEHMNFNVGNAVKYLWRHADKDKPLEDLKKARWYIDREIQLREQANTNAT